MLSAESSSFVSDFGVSSCGSSLLFGVLSNPGVVCVSVHAIAVGFASVLDGSLLIGVLLGLGAVLGVFLPGDGAVLAF